MKKLLLPMVSIMLIVLSCAKKSQVTDKNENLTVETQQRSATANAAINIDKLSLRGRKTNGYIITFKNSTSAAFSKKTLAKNAVEAESNAKAMNDAVKKVARNLLSKHNVEEKKIRTVFSIIPAIHGSFSIEELRKFANDPLVESITPNETYNAIEGSVAGGFGGGLPPISYVPPGVMRVGLFSSPTTFDKEAWILDTGCDLDHPDLNVDVTRARSFCWSDATLEDQNGHGTHIAGIIGAKRNAIGGTGCVPNTTIIPVKVCEPDGTVYVADLIQGMDYIKNAYTPQPKFINVSLWFNTNNPLPALDTALNNLAANNYVFLCAGNAANDCSAHPMTNNTTNPNVFVISNIDPLNDNFASTSCFGNTIDYAAPGQDVYSTYLSGTYTTMSGTSMAAPHALGVALKGWRNRDFCTIPAGAREYAINDPDGVSDEIVQFFWFNIDCSLAY